MALRMLVYVGLLYQDLVAQHKLSKHGKLPPVLPIVLYHGHTPWHAATGMGQLMLPAPEGLERFQPALRYLLVDRHHEQGHGGIVGLLFQLLSADTDVEMRLAIDAIAERVRAPDMDAARDSLVRWLRLTLQDASLQTSMDLEEGFTMGMQRKFTFEEMFDPGMFERPIAKAREQAIIEGREQGLSEGRQQGLSEGRQQGLLEGLQQGLQEGIQQGRQAGREDGERMALRRVVRSLLTEDSATPEVEAMITAANSEQLNGWIEALLKGASPRQVFAGD